MYPENLVYTKTHEWVKNENGEGVVGITEYAVKELKDVVFIELPSPGTAVSGNSPFGTIESVKAVSDLNSPVSGEVIAVNEALRTNVEAVVSDPHNEGWIMRVKLANEGELDNLMSAKEYEGYIGGEECHKA